MVSLTYDALRRRHTHSPKAECFSFVICLWPGHVQRMDRICMTPNFERHVELSITINDPCLPIEPRDVDQLGTLGARIDCIHYRPVAQSTPGVRDTGRNLVGK
jgi:hypothetical protein